MAPTTEDQLPPPPRFATDTEIDPSTEVDVDLGDEEDQLDLAIPNEGHEQVLSPATVPDGVEYLGTYASLEMYFRAQLEPEIARGCQWILDHLDYAQVKARWESDGSRLVCESGCVYKIESRA